MHAPSHIAKLNSQRNDTIYLVRGGTDNTGQKAWYYVRVDSPKVNAFLKAISAGSVNFDEFGTLLESGYGEEPTDSAKQRMKETYDFETGASYG